MDPKYSKILDSFYEKMQELTNKTHNDYGLQKQLDMAQEESAELIVAIAHFNRGRITIEDDVLEEMADTYLMIFQLVHSLDIPENDWYEMLKKQNPTKISFNKLILSDQLKTAQKILGKLIIIIADLKIEQSHIKMDVLVNMADTYIMLFQLIESLNISENDWTNMLKRKITKWENQINNGK